MAILACYINSVDLLAVRGTIVESSEPICWPSVPSGHVIWTKLSANRSQRVKTT